MIKKKGGFDMDSNCPNKDGAYVIQEQGDLGLGTTAIDPKLVDRNGNIATPEFDVGENTSNEK